MTDTTLTPEMISAFNQITGGKVNPVNPSAGPSRADQIRALAKGGNGDESSNIGSVAGKPIVGGVVGSLLKPVVNFGKEAAAGIGANAAVHKIDTENKATSDADLENIKSLVTKEHEMKAAGQDTAHIRDMIKNYKVQSGQSLADLYPEINDTNEQVVGNALGTLLAVTAGGGVEAGVEGVTGAKTLGQGIASGAKIGATYGAGGAASSAMGNNGSAKDVAESTVKGAAGGAVVGAGTEGLLHGAIHAPEIAGSVDVKDAITGKVKSITGPEQNDLEKISETISPKPTVKQAKLATDEGRLFKGNKGTLLKSGTEDKIALSEQQGDSVRTIHNLIPDAAQMDEPTLYTALDEKIGETAKTLKPEMEATQLHPDTIEKIGSDWEEIKAKQSDNAYTPSDVNVKKLQADFDERIKDIGDKTNMNELWETRKAYDGSVPTNVKTATDLSSESLQAKKEIWLQNRKILTDAINDSENGMGETSKVAFKDMRNMYEAQNGILSKAKVETKIEPSKVSQFFNKTTTGKVAKHVLKGAVGAGVGKTLGGTPGEIAGGVIGAGL